MLRVKYGEFGALAANNFLVTDEKTGEAALVDCSSDKLDMMRFIGTAKLKYILLTHGHFDHCDGVRKVAEETGAKIVIAEADHIMSKDTTYNVSKLFGNGWTEYTPDITVSDGDRLYLGKEEIRVIATPGHTPGSVCYLAGKNLFSGDTLMSCGIGRTDLPGGDDGLLIDSLRKIVPLAEKCNLYPGHGEVILR